MSDNVFKILQKLPFFTGLEGQNLRNLMKIAKRKVYKANELIFREGEDSKSLLVCIQGNLSFYKGKDKLKTLSGPICLGEIGLFYGEKRSGSLMTINPCTCFEFKDHDLFKYLENNKNAAHQININIAQSIFKQIEVNNKQFQDCKIKLQNLSNLSMFFSLYQTELSKPDDEFVFSEINLDKNNKISIILEGYDTPFLIKQINQKNIIIENSSDAQLNNILKTFKAYLLSDFLGPIYFEGNIEVTSSEEIRLVPNRWSCELRSLIKVYKAKFQR